jgi:hypothetical protein
VTCDDLIFCSRLRGFQGSAWPRVAIRLRVRAGSVSQRPVIFSRFSG